jgi:hypothetical protein
MYEWKIARKFNFTHTLSSSPVIFWGVKYNRPTEQVMEKLYYISLNDDKIAFCEWAWVAGNLSYRAYYLIPGARVMLQYKRTTNLGNIPCLNIVLLIVTISVARIVRLNKKYIQNFAQENSQIHVEKKDGHRGGTILT